MKKAMVLATLLKRFKISFCAIILVSLCVSLGFATEHDATKYISDSNKQNGLSNSQISSLKNGDTINVKNNFNVVNNNHAYYNNLDITINGNGYTLNEYPYSAKLDTGFLINLSTITVNNYNFSGDLGSEVFSVENSKLTLNNLNFTVDYTSVSSSNSVVILNNSNISTENDDAIKFVYNSSATITNSNISSIDGIALNMDDAKSIDIIDSNIHSENNIGLYSKNLIRYRYIKNSKISSQNNIGLYLIYDSYAGIENSEIYSKNSDAMRLEADSSVILMDTDVLSEGGNAIVVEDAESLRIYSENKDVLIDSPIGSYGISVINCSTINLVPTVGKKITISNGIYADSNSIIFIANGAWHSGDRTVELGGNSDIYSFYIVNNGKLILLEGATFVTNEASINDGKMELLEGAKFEANKTYISNVKLLKGAKFISNETVAVKGEFDSINGSIESPTDIYFGKFSVNSYYYDNKLKLNFDVDLNKEESDYFGMNGFIKGNPSAVAVNKVNIMTDTTKDKVSIPFTNHYIEYPYMFLYPSQEKICGPIYTYDVELSTYAISSTQGNYINFSKTGYNPNALTGKVAVAGVSVSQEEVLNTVFNNAGNYSFFSKQMLPINKVNKEVSEPEYRAAPTIWVKAFGSQEDVDLQDYTKLKTNYFGAVIGIDWDRQYWDNFDATYGLFASYVGGELKDDELSSNKVKQNGGYLGVRGNWYLDKLFINGIVDLGYIQNGADTSVDSNNFNSSIVGIAARVGYNFELYERSFTLQPNLGLTGKYIMTDDFEFTSAGQKLKQKFDNVTNITIEPGVKLAKNLGECWILTGEGKYVVENTNGDINVEYSNSNFDVVLPDMDYKNYASVGLGIEKMWYYTVLNLKVNKTFGGRDGFVVNAGVEYKF